MSRTSIVGLVSALALLLALVTVSMAGALPVEKPQTVRPSGGGWWVSALTWLEDLAGFPRPVRGHSDRSTAQSTKTTIVYPTGGSCIDPSGGRPRPSGCD